MNARVWRRDAVMLGALLGLLAPGRIRCAGLLEAPRAVDQQRIFGCFRIQLVVLGILIVLTPLSVVWQWPPMVSAILLFVVIGLLLITGQTIIFLLRLVAADRRGRRRPLASGTKTVGELADEAGASDEASTSDEADPRAADDAGSAVEPSVGPDTAAPD